MISIYAYSSRLAGGLGSQQEDTSGWLGTVGKHWKKAYHCLSCLSHKVGGQFLCRGPVGFGVSDILGPQKEHLVTLEMRHKRVEARAPAVVTHSHSDPWQAGVGVQSSKRKLG